MMTDSPTVLQGALGRNLAQREREDFAYGFHSREYCADIDRLMALGVEEPENEES
jgi:hypothetical protein